jgi:predicted DCC family thiol-disulfide oxidoreductase YuxK
MSLVRLFSFFDDHPPTPRALTASLLPPCAPAASAVPRARPARGTLGYDRDCRMCRATARIIGPFAHHHGFRLAPLQSPAMRRALGGDGGVPDEIKLLCADGRVLGGVSALLAIVTIVPWLARLRRVARCRPLRAALDRGYRWVAAHRRCSGRGCHQV